MSNALEQELIALLGPGGWLPSGETDGYRRDWLDQFGETPLGVARPASVEQVSATVRACARAGVAIVPQGGNTGLCGGSVLGRAGGVIVSLARMAGMEEPAAASGTVLVEAGLVLARLHEALVPSGLMFPMHLGSEGSAQIGGLIGTNAGGSHAFRYGMMQDLVAGLEVVLPDGRVWNGLRPVQKDNAGYQLRRLFCGSEGTLGIVTRAVLKLFPAPAQSAVALLVAPEMSAAVRFGTELRAQAAEFLTALEFFSDFGLAMALRHVRGLVFPLSTRDGCFLLVELTSSSLRVPLQDILAGCLEWGLGEGLILDGTLAQSEFQRRQFWRLREEQPEGQRLEGPQLKHDISVPAGRLAEFINAAGQACREVLPGVRINPFGHLADGNVHYNLSPPVGTGSFAGKKPQLADALALLAAKTGGSFAAEHGLGRAKVDLADRLRAPVERDLMRAVKKAVDPKGLLNPGTILRTG